MYQEALSILKNIDKRRLKPDIYTFTTLLMACGRTNGSDAVSIWVLYSSVCTFVTQRYCAYVHGNIVFTN